MSITAMCSRLRGLQRVSISAFERAGGQAQYIVHEPPTSDDTSIGQLLLWIEQNLRRNLPLPFALGSNTKKWAIRTTRELDDIMKRHDAQSPSQQNT
jgi:hypothetical protein